MDFKRDASRGIESIPVVADDELHQEDVHDFVYVTKAVPGPGSTLSEFEDEFEGCQCNSVSNVNKSVCLNNACTCLHGYGSPYDEKGILVGVDPYNSSMKPIYECNKFCKCPSYCINRVVQKGIRVALQIFPAGSKGLGLRSLEGISKGQFVCEYAGQVLSKAVAKHRAESQRESDCNYILVLREHLADGKVICTYVDPQTTGNAGRFINHSCQPNLFMVPVRIDNNVPRLALFALRDIQPSEELCYDYSGEIFRSEVAESATETTDSEDTDVSRLDANVAVKPSRGKIRSKACLCGAKLCRGSLPLDESLYE